MMVLGRSMFSVSASCDCRFRAWSLLTWATRSSRFARAPTFATADSIPLIAVSRSPRFASSAVAVVIRFFAMSSTTLKRSLGGVPKASGPVVSTRICSVSETRRNTSVPPSPALGAATPPQHLGTPLPDPHAVGVVGLGARHHTAEQGATLDVLVRQREQALAQRLHLGGQCRPAGVGVRAGAQALHREVADATGGVEHLLESGVGLLEPVAGVVDVPLLLGVRRLQGTRLHRHVRAGGRVGRRTDEPARRELLLQLAHGVEVAVEALQAGERDGTLRDPHSDHRPTRPVRLISTSSVSSMAVIMRPAAEYACWKDSMLVISSSMLTPETDSRAASTWVLITCWMPRLRSDTAACTPRPTIMARYWASAPVGKSRSCEILSALLLSSTGPVAPGPLPEAATLRGSSVSTRMLSAVIVVAGGVGPSRSVPLTLSRSQPSRCWVFSAAARFCATLFRSARWSGMIVFSTLSCPCAVPPGFTGN